MNKRQIQARLIEQGLSFRQFALTKGYEPRTVTQTVERWAGSETLPNGRIAFSVMRDLSTQIGVELIPGLLDHLRQGLLNLALGHYRENEKMKRPILETRRQVMSAVVCTYPGGRECAAARLGLPLKRLDNQVYENAAPSR